MPKKSYFFDAIIRQEPIDEDQLDPLDNLEEFSPFSAEDLEYWKSQAESIKGSNRAVVANLGGTAIGDIALVPAVNLKNPKGIRDISEWYMSTMMRRNYLHTIFEKQTDIAIRNLKSAWEILGEGVDVLFMCGTDFGTQESTFCDKDTFRELYLPYYRKMNDWVHQHTSWKTFKHSCGAVESFMPLFIESGFDIINPVQINAAGMDPALLKEKYGEQLVFWGGGADTQKILPFAGPQEVKEHVRKECEILAPGGGFVFNTVHNIQANVPLENVLAMLETIREFRM
jgi:uroporphyrinogen-III decarboxylase